MKEKRKRDADAPPRKPTLATVAWQGWRMEMPARWYPLKLEGNYDEGHALFADMLRPRLGVRWYRPKRRKWTVEGTIKTRLREEIGKLAADEATPYEIAGDAWKGSTLYVEPDPPGRDIWIGYSETSNRFCELAYHSKRRERMLSQTLVPTVNDLPPAEPMPWSIFELSCIVPPELELKKQQLNAGDLSLTFADKKRQVTIRQIAVAEIALSKRPLDKWLAVQQRIDHKYHKPLGKPEPIELEAGERKLVGYGATLRRRIRFSAAFWHPARLATYALHDAARDRLVLATSTDAELAEQLIKSVGWARTVGVDDRDLDEDDE